MTVLQRAERPSPRVSAASHCGERMIGGDGKLWISKANSNNVCRWQRDTSSSAEKFAVSARLEPGSQSRKSKAKAVSIARKKAASKISPRAAHKSEKQVPNSRGNLNIKEQTSKTSKTSNTKKIKKANRSTVKSTPDRSPSKAKRFVANKAISPMLAKVWNGQDVRDYMVSEKLDGVRAIYQNKQFYSRTGKLFNVPDWFRDTLKHIPNGVVLDGEFYTKRADFGGVMSIVGKKIPLDTDWRKLTYYVFDLPLSKGDARQRYKELQKLFPKTSTGAGRAQLVKQFKVASQQALDKKHDNVASKGGEGLMLKLDTSFYVFKRSANLLKYKKFKDGEARIVGSQLGSGKNVNVMGTLFVEWIGGKHKGVHFKVGSGFTDLQRQSWKQWAKKGKILTVRYDAFDNTSGKPRFPTFVGLRDKRDVL